MLSADRPINTRAEDRLGRGGFADTLAGELETYLVGYARERSYVLAARPVVRFLVDEDLKLGRFDVIGELLSPEELAEELGDNLFADDDEYALPLEPGAGGEPPGIRKPSIPQDNSAQRLKRLRVNSQDGIL